MKAILCQFDIAWEDPKSNYERVRSLLHSRKIDPGTLIVLPELFASGFSMNTEVIAEPEFGPTSNFLAGVARELSCGIIGGVAIRDAEGVCTNQSLAFGPEGNILGRYLKQQPFTLGGEAANYKPGTGSIRYEFQEFQSISPYVCYDLRFPEIFRHSVRRGAQVFVVIANWPVARIGHWTTLLQARAIENQAYVIGVNRTGADPSLRYSGRSMVIAPGGEIILDAGEEPGAFEAELSLESLLTYRSKLPFLADIRSDYVE